MLAIDSQDTQQSDFENLYPQLQFEMRIASCMSVALTPWEGCKAYQHLSSATMIEDRL